MTSEPRKSLREIAQQVRWSILFLQGLNNAPGVEEHEPDKTLGELQELLQIDADEAQRLVREMKTTDQINLYVEGRRKVLRPNWENEL